MPPHHVESQKIRWRPTSKKYNTTADTILTDALACVQVRIVDGRKRDARPIDQLRHPLVLAAAQHVQIVVECRRSAAAGQHQSTIRIVEAAAADVAAEAVHAVVVVATAELAATDDDGAAQQQQRGRSENALKPGATFATCNVIGRLLSLAKYRRIIFHAIMLQRARRAHLAVNRSAVSWFSNFYRTHRSKKKIKKLDPLETMSFIN